MFFQFKIFSLMCYIQISAAFDHIYTCFHLMLHDIFLDVVLVLVLIYVLLLTRRTLIDWIVNIFCTVINVYVKDFVFMWHFCLKGSREKGQENFGDEPRSFQKFPEWKFFAVKCFFRPSFQRRIYWYIIFIVKQWLFLSTWRNRIPTFACGSCT